MGHEHPGARAVARRTATPPAVCATRARPTTASSRGSGARPQYTLGGASHIMTPLPKTVYGPDDWEDASLDDWLKPSK